MILKLTRLISDRVASCVMLRQKIVIMTICMCILSGETVATPEVIWSVNAGGEAHTDAHGIRYQADQLEIGIPSDYGKTLMIQRVVPQDQILYQTERYHTDTFGYDVPITRDGDYVLVLKFSEVWFTAPNQKVFDVVLNSEHHVVEGLDIFARVGRGSAHDEYVPFSVKNNHITIDGESSTLSGQKLTVEFLKGERDNPKVNAMYVLRGTMNDVPQLPAMPGFDEMQQQPEEFDSDDEDYDDDTTSQSADKTYKRPSGPKVQDPYAADDTNSMLLPIVVAIGAFIPILFCLCKL